MSSQDNIQIVRMAYQHFMSGNIPALCNDFSEDQRRWSPKSATPVAAMIVRATRSGSSIIGMCPTPGKSTHVAPGRRSRAVWPYVAAGTSRSNWPQARVTGHGSGSIGSICSSGE